MNVCRTGVTEAVAGSCWDCASLPGTLGFLGSVPAQSKGVARLVGTGHSFYVLGSRAGLGLIHSWILFGRGKLRGRLEASSRLQQVEGK